MPVVHRPPMGRAPGSTMPCSPPAAPDQAPPAAAATGLAPLVRVVDDEPSILSLFLNLAQTAGFSVETYGTAADFLAELDESRPGCLVLDLNLPDRTGLQVLQELSARQCRLPVVFMSG
ncbi:MAG: response regulator, partial [Planctomycetes bacterium]|nr:response regulator [Planctomycetota bacterium]